MSAINFGSPTNPIDLSTLGRYEVTYEEESEESRNDPWMKRIRCQGKGLYIYPAGGKYLAVSLERRPHIAKRLAAIEGVELQQDGDDEKTFLFDVALWPQVAEVVKPIQLRGPSQLSEEHKAALKEAASKYWPSKGQQVGR